MGAAGHSLVAGQGSRRWPESQFRKPPRAARRDVYVYFDNDAKVRAPFDAQALQTRVSELMPRGER